MSMQSLRVPSLTRLRKFLAFELTKMIHGEEEATKAQNAAKALFGRRC